MSLRKSAASFAILLLLASSLVVTPVGGTHGGTPKIQILGIDYTTAPTCTPAISGVSGACVQGIGSFVVLEVQDSGVAASVNTRTVRVTSTIDLAGEDIVLTRHTPSTGTGANTFYGTLGFEPTATASNGRVRVVHGDNVVASYTDTSGTPTTATLRYFNSNTGTFVLDAANYYGNWSVPGGTEATSFARVTITDADLNGNPAVAEQHDSRLFVRTSADLNTEINVTVVETGINTGVFEGRFNFTTGPSTNGTFPNTGSAIQVVGGFGPEGPIATTVTVRYVDATDVLGNNVSSTKTVTWQESRQGTVSFVKSDFSTLLGGVYNGTEKAYLRVVDLDRDTSSSADTVTVLVSSTTGQPAPKVSVTLTETAAHSGEFTGSIDLVAAPSTGKLVVSDVSPGFGATQRENLTAEYDDLRNGTGADPAVVTATAGWNRFTDGTVRLTRIDGASDASDFYGACTATAATCATLNTVFGRMYIRVDDVDRNTDPDAADTIPAVVSSTLNARRNVTVTLTETGANTAIFTGSATFIEGRVPGPSELDGIWVVDRSTVTVNYTDVNSVGTTVDRTDTALWHKAATANITTDAIPTTEVAPVLTVFGERLVADGTQITLTDTDANVNPAVADTVTVTVSSSTAGAVNVSVTLTEIAANAGVFRGAVGFTTGSSTTDRIKVDAGANVSVSFSDPRNATGTPSVILPMSGGANFRWNASTSENQISVSTNRSWGGDVVTVYVANTTSATTINRCVHSTFNEGTTATALLHGVNMTLTNVSTGLFKGTLTITDSGSGSTGVINVSTTLPGIQIYDAACSNDGDGIYDGIAHANLTWGGPYAAPTNVAFMNSAFSGLLPFNHRDFGTGRSAYLEVVDADANKESDMVEVLTVSVGDETSMPLIETAANSSTFRRAVLYEATPTAANGLIGVASTTTLSYTDTRPAAAAVTDTVTWYRAGTITFQDSLAGATVTSYTGARTMFLEIQDPFQSKALGIGDDTSVDTFTVTATSRDGGDSESITVTETGPDTGVFRGSIALVTTATGASSGQLSMGPNNRTDLVTVFYQDTSTEQDVDVVVGSVTWNRAETGVLCLVTPPVIGQDFLLTACSAGNSQPAIPPAGAAFFHGLAGHGRQSYVFLNDAGLDTSAVNTQDIRIFSTSDATGITVTARETQVRSGLFLASFGLTNGTSSQTGGTLKVAEGDLITATYTDTTRSDGTSAAVLSSNTVQWNQTFTGTLTADKRKYGGTESAILTLTDKDLDTTTGVDTVTISYRNINFTNDLGQNITGTITLTETGAQTGIFRATSTQFQNTSTPTGGVVQVHANGSRIIFTHAEDRDVDGRTPLFPSVTVHYRPANSGFVTFDLPLYATFAATGIITVVDSGMNANAVAAETGTVRVLSNSDPAGEVITVTETGLNTGVFTGPLSFESARVVDNGKVLVSDGDLVTVIYYDVLDGSTTPNDAIDTDTARFQSAAVVAPTAILSAVPTSGAPPLAVTFTLGATDDGQITSWSLDINNDGTSEYTGTDNLKSGSITRSHSYGTAGTFTAKLTVVDNTGNSGSATQLISVATSGVVGAPTATLTASPTSGVAPLPVSFTLNATDDVSIANWTLDIDSAGTFEYSGTNNLSAAGVIRNHTYAAAGSFVAKLTVTDNLGNTANSTQTITVTAPVVPGAPVPTLTAASLTGVAPFVANFTIAGTDEGNITSWSLDANGDGTADFTGTDNLKLGSTQRNFTYSVPGTYLAKLTVTDNSSTSANTTVTITVTAAPAPSNVTAAAIQAANMAVVVTVTRSGDDNIVSWTLPSNLPATPKGVQIFRSLSPFTLLKTIPATDADYTDRSFADEGAPATAKYLVTFFYGFTPAEGFFPGTGDPEGVIPGFAALGSGSSVGGSGGAGGDDGLSTLAWVLIVLGVVVVLALIVLLVIMLTRKKDEEAPAETQPGWATEPVPEPAPAEAPPAPAGEVHTLRCPACSTEFQATGSKPLTTNCPSCGRRGILR